MKQFWISHLKFYKDTQAAETMSDIREYKISVPQDKIDRLRRKLDDYIWPSELEDAGWDYGSPK